MNALKNMEVVFIAALALAGFMSYATADVTAPATKAAVAASSDIATVVVTAKRLTAAEKASIGS